MDTTITLSKWGNSLGLRIPAGIAKTLDLSPGDVVDVDVKDRILQVKKTNCTVFDMQSKEFEEACRDAVLNRDDAPMPAYVTRLDPETGNIMKVFSDGRVEYVLD
ncbi:MAG: AbrB/MazE/SpoVT family DNA-binding domain-containing protein [Oscillospiraceae bacterium]|nr:AbrB/MazE/SpoVT family DNA-binding domain-containing protein [Oscillospiraceae bacterium]